jgi:hypothetical protein
VDPLTPFLTGGIIAPEYMVRRLIDISDGDRLEKSGAEVARKNLSKITEAYRSNGISFEFDEVMREILGGYFQMFRIEGDSLYKGHRVMTLSHGRGLKWSRFLRSYLLRAYGIVSKEKVEIEITDGFLKVIFSPGRAQQREM